MKRFRTHGVVLVLIAVAVAITILSHSIRLRLEWGTGGFVLGLLVAAVAGADHRRHRKHPEAP